MADVEADAAPLCAGARVRYRGSDGEQLCSILKVHHDDIEPYYTIRLPDGRERATTHSRLEALRTEEAGDLSANLWYYRDDDGVQRGPFQTEDMRGWLEHFAGTTRVAPSYYGEVPTRFWRMDELWSRPDVEAFMPARCSAPPEDPAPPLPPAASAPPRRPAHAPAPDPAPAAPRVAPATSGAPKRSGSREYWDAAAGALAGGSERRDKFMGLMGANKRPKPGPSCGSRGAALLDAALSGRGGGSVGAGGARSRASAADASSARSSVAAACGAQPAAAATEARARPNAAFRRQTSQFSALERQFNRARGGAPGRGLG